MTGLSLAGLPGGNLGPLSSVTANGTNEHDLGHAALQHALRRSLLGDNSSLSHYNQSLASGGVLSSQHHHHQQLQSKLQGEERELLLQHLRRQQEQFQQQQQQQQCLQRDQLQQGQERTLGRRDQD